MNIGIAIAEILKSLSIFLNPERREKAVLRGAIESAEQLLLILRKQGIYATMDEDRRKKLEIHYQKRFDSWKDGK